MYFNSAKEALARLHTEVKRGTTNIDVGCMQINYRWHAHEFASLSDMMDPQTNVQYAAEYLVHLKDEFGTWKLAIANYHSRDETRGETYLKKVRTAWSKLDRSNPQQTSQPIPVSIPTKSRLTQLYENGLKVTSNSQSQQLLEPKGLPDIARARKVASQLAAY